MSTAKIPDDLVSVAKYTEMRELGAVQVVNGWCRKQDAPFHEVEGKRMISVSEMDAWVAEKKERKATGKGTTHADIVQRKTGVRTGAMTAHNARAGVVISEVSKITDYMAWMDTAHGAQGKMPMQWHALSTKLKKGELSLVNPHIVTDLLIAHFEHLGPAEHEQELELLLKLRAICNPEADEDLVGDLEIDEPQADEETEEDEQAE